MNARPVGALALGAAGAALLHAGGLSWAGALLGGGAAVTFAAWRTLAGAGLAFALVGACAAVAGQGGDATAVVRALLPGVATLELLGVATLVLAARRAARGRPSRRLVSAWLASSGAMLVGLACLARVPGLEAGPPLVLGALAYRMGAVPAYAWAPLLVRHDDRDVARVGLLSFVAAMLVTVRALMLLTGRPGTIVTLVLLGGTALPWNAWRASRQWESDRRCARSYALAAAGAGVLLMLAALLRV